MIKPLLSSLIGLTVLASAAPAQANERYLYLGQTDTNETLLIDTYTTKLPRFGDAVHFEYIVSENATNNIRFVRASTTACKNRSGYAHFDWTVYNSNNTIKKVKGTSNASINMIMAVCDAHRHMEW